MSFEDDEYWDDEYSAKSRPVSYADNTAVARDRYADELDLEPPPPRRRAGRPVDELAVRRRRRNTGPSGTPRGEFDSERPAWLDDPDFVPTDITQPDPEAAVLDFNRPELGSNFDNPEFPSGRRLPAARDDWDDEIDEPFDHRAGLDRRSALPSLAPPSGPYDEDEWDQPAPPRRPFAPRPSSGRPYAAPRPVPSREPELPATGRAQVPYDDEYGPGLRDDDALELYRPRRSSRDDDRRRDPSRDRPAARRTEPSRVEPGGYDDDDLRWDRDRPVSPAAEAPDSPRVISRPVPSPAPRVISRAAQPPAPRVVNKAQPTLPAVVSGPPQSAPARPLPPTSPTSPTSRRAGRPRSARSDSARSDSARSGLARPGCRFGCAVASGLHALSPARIRCEPWRSRPTRRSWVASRGPAHVSRGPAHVSRAPGDAICSLELAPSRGDARS